MPTIPSALSTTTSALDPAASPTPTDNWAPPSASLSPNPNIIQARSSFTGLEPRRKEMEARGGGGRGGGPSKGKGKGGKTPGGGENENNNIIECQNSNITACVDGAPPTLSFKSKLLVGASIVTSLAIQVLVV